MSGTNCLWPRTISSIRGCASPSSVCSGSSSSSTLTTSFCKNSNCSSAAMSAESPVCTGNSDNMAFCMKRWNSVPMNINFCHKSPNAATISPSSSSSSSSDSSNADTPMADTTVSSPVEREEDEDKPSEMSVFLVGRRHTSSGVSSRRRGSNLLPRLTSSMILRLRDRGIEKLKREADVKRCIENDYAGEKFSISGAVVMETLDELGIDEAPTNSQGRKRTQSLTEPVHILTSFLTSPCSPSPTRAEKQFYSPSMQQVVRGSTLSPSTSPSPSRQQCVRSLSPIAARNFCLKRRYDSDTEGCSSPSPAKRSYSSLPSTPPTSAPHDRFPKIAHRMLGSNDHSMSMNSADSASGSSTISSAYASGSGQHVGAFPGNSLAFPLPTSISSQTNSQVGSDDTDMDMDIV